MTVFNTRYQNNVTKRPSFRLVTTCPYIANSECSLSVKVNSGSQVVLCTKGQTCQNLQFIPENRIWMETILTDV